MTMTKNSAESRQITRKKSNVIKVQQNIKKMDQLGVFGTYIIVNTF